MITPFRLSILVRYLLCFLWIYNGFFTVYYYTFIQILGFHSRYRYQHIRVINLVFRPVVKHIVFLRIYYTLLAVLSWNLGNIGIFRVSI